MSNVQAHRTQPVGLDCERRKRGTDQSQPVLRLDTFSPTPLPDARLSGSFL